MREPASKGRRAGSLGAMMLACVMLLAPGLAAAQGITVQPGATLSLGSGQASLGCGDLVVEGQVNIDSGALAGIRDLTISGGELSGNSGTVSLSGDWMNFATFSAGSGAVMIVDGCGRGFSTIAGNNDFNHFSVTSSIGKLLAMQAETSQTFAGNLTLQGIPGNRLMIRSTTAGLQTFFSLSAGSSQSIFAVDVSDNNALGGQQLAPGQPQASQSVDSGNNENWFGDLLDSIFRDGFEL